MTKESQHDTDKPKLLYKISFLRAHFNTINFPTWSMFMSAAH